MFFPDRVLVWITLLLEFALVMTPYQLIHKVESLKRITYLAAIGFLLIAFIYLIYFGGK
jgi:hypothetical protein